MVYSFAYARSTKEHVAGLWFEVNKTTLTPDYTEDV
ncbi:hypothetical protein B0I24_101217 [Aliidiomarina maris]|uniref:Uncharacterized protein n=1 Tax=Aliidiomarina maris TaxID=531312 RepID=A0A327X683_9GAMM|nr:hypothetical protein B0I24_101217 [Aliidiomarina maris]